MTDEDKDKDTIIPSLIQIGNVHVQSTQTKNGLTKCKHVVKELLKDKTIRAYLKGFERERRQDKLLSYVE